MLLHSLLHISGQKRLLICFPVFQILSSVKHLILQTTSFALMWWGHRGLTMQQEKCAIFKSCWGYIAWSAFIWSPGRVEFWEVSLYMCAVFWHTATNSLINLFGGSKRLRSLPLFADKLTKGDFNLLGTTEKGEEILHLCAISVCCTWWGIMPLCHPSSLISTVPGCSDFNPCPWGDAACTCIFGQLQCVDKWALFSICISLLEQLHPAWLPLVGVLTLILVPDPKSAWQGYPGSWLPSGAAPAPVRDRPVESWPVVSGPEQCPCNRCSLHAAVQRHCVCCLC